MIPNIKYKTSLCKNWLCNEKCPKGPSCYFAHGQPELRTVEENAQEIAYKHQYLRNFDYYAGYKPKELENFKTVRCKFFLKGECKLGNECTFAHTNEQIRLKMPLEDFFGLQNLSHQGQLHQHSYYQDYDYQQPFPTYNQMGYIPETTLHYDPPEI